MTSANVKDQALQLSVEERLELASTLWDSVEAEAENLPVHDWQKRILDKRLAAAEQSPDGWLTWDEVKERVAALRGKRPRA